MVCIPTHVWRPYDACPADRQARQAKQGHSTLYRVGHPVTWFRPGSSVGADRWRQGRFTCTHIHTHISAHLPGSPRYSPHHTQISMPLKYPSTITTTSHTLSQNYCVYTFVVHRPRCSLSNCCSSIGRHTA